MSLVTQTRVSMIAMNTQIDMYKMTSNPPTTEPTHISRSGDRAVVYYAAADYPGDTVDRLRVRLLLSGLTAGEIGRRLGIDASNIRHQLGGRDRLQQKTCEAVVELTDRLLASLKLARPFERRAVLVDEGSILPIVDYSAADDVANLFEFDPAFDRTLWFYLRKCVGLLTKGIVFARDHQGPHLQTATGDYLNVYTTVIHPNNGYYGFKKVRTSEHGVFICRTSRAYDLAGSIIYLLPSSVIAQLAGISGDLFIPDEGVTAPRPTRWTGRDLRMYRVALDFVRNLASEQLPSPVPSPADVCGSTVESQADRWLGCQGPRWTLTDETCLTALWQDPQCSLLRLTIAFPGRDLMAILQHAKRMGLPPPPWLPSSRQEWSSVEDDVLLVLADDPSTDDQVWSIVFPHRSPQSLRGRLQRLRQKRTDTLPAIEQTTTLSHDDQTRGQCNHRAVCTCPPRRRRRGGTYSAETKKGLI